jgi:uncharacterized membrane protein YgaE (UPF0421/DUF939 family)
MLFDKEVPKGDIMCGWIIGIALFLGVMAVIAQVIGVSFGVVLAVSVGIIVALILSLLLFDKLDAIKKSKLQASAETGDPKAEFDYGNYLFKKINLRKQRFG